jgi:cupin 2 domain-containing protein
MTITIRNIFTGANAPAGLEACSTLFEDAKVRVERIVSNAHSSPAGFWYDQPEDEWVMILRGQARLEFASGESVALRAGDYVMIARHVRHRVGATDAETIWLAVHVKPQ